MSDTPSSTANQTSLSNAALLVAGTCIGGGMLALPTVSGEAGFFPSTYAMVLIWLAMTCTALCLVELSLKLPKNCHVISIADHYLGKNGKNIAWVLFLFMSYASLVAYIAGSGHLLAQAVSRLGFPVSKSMGCILFSLLSAPFIFLPHTKLAKLNSYLCYLMILAFICIVTTGIPYIQTKNLEHENWSSLYKAIPLILTSFSFQTMVPSLPPLLGFSRKKLWIACCVGTFVPLVVYVIWQWVILGAVPLEGANGLFDAYAKGSPATDSLHALNPTPMLALGASSFAFFALVTSFLGLALGLFDFLADGCAISRSTRKGRILLTALVLGPSLLFALYYERAFLVALDVSGGFGDTLLNGCMPLLMVGTGTWGLWKKYKTKMALLYLGLVFVGAIFLTSFSCEVYARLKLGDTIYDTQAAGVIELEQAH